jgi:hypothetical protein
VEASGRRGAPRTELSQSSRGRPFLLAASVVLLVFLVALGSSRSLARVRGPGHVLDARPIVGDLAVVFFLLALVVLVAIGFMLRGGRWRRRRDDEPEQVFEREPMPWWLKPVLLLIALLPVGGIVAVIVFAGHGSGRQIQTIAPRPGVTVPQRPAEPGAGATDHASAPLVHWWFWAALAGVVLAIAGVVAILRRTRRGADEGARAVAASDLRAAIEESLDELEREPDPRRAVIRAYLGMERALAGRGLGRRPFEAPREYLVRVLDTIRVSRTPGERLTALFQRARFSQHPIDRGMKREAITALATVRDELGGEGH